ncbi:unnamed protein product [Ambrosiozyma monospora]|uniref:Unnamed protein product n=1 Tax=Ambrosiozyma monospora TaxID=43982 RepID=A0ACB5TM79_AMBMO|nr:unnamed protein product [Ambrosiozyma monospora]
MTKESLKALNKKNRMVQTPELVDIIGGLNEKPVLLSFWPSSDREFNNKNFHGDFKQVELFKECPRCFDFRNIWSKVLKNLATEVNNNEIEFGFVNCLSNEKICSSLGMDDLVRGDPADYDPRLFMFLPSQMGGNKIRYKDSKLSAKKLSNWSRRLLSFYTFEDTSYKQLGSKMNLNRNLPSLGGVAELQSDPKVAYVFLYDEETLVPEDELILHQLVQPIMDLNRNAYLYKSSDAQRFLRFIEQRETELANNYLNEYVEEGEEKLQFDKVMFETKTLSVLPMMLCIKENSLLSPVYQSFNSRDMRDIVKVTDFIKANADPTYEELNLYSKKQIFPRKFDPKIHDYTEKVVVAILDDNDYTDMFKKSYYLTFINQSVNYVKQIFQFKNLLAKRNLKYEEMERVGPRRAVKALQKKIDNVFKVPEYRVSTVYMTRTTLLFSQKWWPYIDVSN